MPPFKGMDIKEYWTYFKTTITQSKTVILRMFLGVTVQVKTIFLGDSFSDSGVHVNHVGALVRSKDSCTHLHDGLY